jgi:protein transport protein SEC61 subunit gamma-like protein
MEEVNLQTQQKVEPKQEQKIEKPKGPGLVERLKNRIAKYKRVIDVARKPTREDFVSSAKITGVGITILGVIGFVIFLLYFLVVR